MCQEITCFQWAEPYKTIQRKTRIFHKITLHPAAVSQHGAGNCTSAQCSTSDASCANKKGGDWVELFVSLSYFTLLVDSCLPSPRLSRYQSFLFSAFFHLWLVLYSISTIPLCLHNTRRVFPSVSFSLAPCTPVKRRSFACFARWIDSRETTCSDFGSRLLLQFVSFTVKRAERRLLFVTVVCTFRV